MSVSVTRSSVSSDRGPLRLKYELLLTPSCCPHSCPEEERQQTEWCVGPEEWEDKYNKHSSWQHFHLISGSDFLLCLLWPFTSLPTRHTKQHLAQASPGHFSILNPSSSLQPLALDFRSIPRRCYYWAFVMKGIELPHFQPAWTIMSPSTLTRAREWNWGKEELLVVQATPEPQPKLCM
jgi:hypothetical protein